MNRQPRKSDIDKFSRFQVQDFESWLRVGLETLFFEKSIRDFKPVEYCIYGENNLSADLQIIYETLSPEKKLTFRVAIAQLILHLPTEQRYAPIFRTLFDLAATIQAFEALKVLPARGEGFLALERESPDAPSLYRAALDLVAELRDQGKDAQACIERLIGTPRSFQPEYARGALIALCKIAPDDFAAHMALLRAPLRSNFEIYHPTENAMQLLVNDIVKAVGLNNIQEHWAKLRFSVSSERSEANDDWFRDGILPLISTEGAGTSLETIVWKTDPSIRIHATRMPYRAVSLAGHYPDNGETSTVELILPEGEPYPQLEDGGVSAQEKAASILWSNILLGIKRSAARFRGLHR